MTHRINQHQFWIPIILTLGLALSATGRAEAQYFGIPGGVDPYPGYGVFGANPGWNQYGNLWAYPGWNSYGGWGAYPRVGWNPWGFGGYGLQLFRYWWPQYEFYRMQALSRNSSRYNLNSAEATTAFEAANIYRQEAMDEMYRAGMQNQRPIQTRPGKVQAGQGTTSPNRAPIQSRTLAPAAFEEMIARDGEVFWPLGAPNQGYLATKQAVATAAIQSVIQQSQAGPVAVRRVVHARNALADYAVPAALALKKDRPDDVDDFAAYVKTLDAGLRSLAMGQTAGRPGSPTRTTKAPDIEPPNSPESAGEVLKRKIERKSDAPPREHQ